MSTYLDRPYRIENIVDLTGEPRTDGRYPQRVGSIVKPSFSGYPCLLLDYIFDSTGNPKIGTLRTSKVNRFEFAPTSDMLIVHTQNSVYYLKMLEDLI